MPLKCATNHVWGKLYVPNDVMFKKNIKTRPGPSVENMHLILILCTPEWMTRSEIQVVQ